MIYFLTLPYADGNVIALSRLLKLRANQAMVLHLIQDVSVNQLQKFLGKREKQFFLLGLRYFFYGGGKVERKINVKSLLNKFYG